MTRRRWVQIDGELVEVGQDYTSPVLCIPDSVLWNDRAYQDMGDARFSSRSQHRAYMKMKGVTVASDYREEWRNREKSRIEAKKGIDPSRKGDIERAISQLNSRRK